MNQNNEYWLNNSYQDNLRFNDMAGNTDKLSFKDMESQEKLIAEETKEIRDALDLRDPVKLLDGVVDAQIVLDGLTSKLVSLGFDVATALKQTIENNISKFPESEEVAKATVEHYKAQGIETTYEYMPIHRRFVIKDTNGKVRKPVGFVPNDLSNCVPAGFTFN